MRAGVRLEDGAPFRLPEQDDHQHGGEETQDFEQGGAGRVRAATPGDDAQRQMAASAIIPTTSKAGVAEKWRLPMEKDTVTQRLEAGRFLRPRTPCHNSSQTGLGQRGRAIRQGTRHLSVHRSLARIAEHLDPGGRIDQEAGVAASSAAFQFGEVSGSRWLSLSSMSQVPNEETISATSLRRLNLAEGVHHRVPFGRRTRDPHGLRQQSVGNINRGLHGS